MARVGQTRGNYSHMYCVCVVDGKDVPYQFTQHMQIRLKQKKEVKNKQQTTFEGGSGYTHTQRRSLSQKMVATRAAVCSLPSALCPIRCAPSAASLCNTSRAWHPSASMLNLILRPHLSASLHEPKKYAEKTIKCNIKIATSKKFRWKVPKNVQNRSRQNSQIRVSVCVCSVCRYCIPCQQWHENPVADLTMTPSPSCCCCCPCSCSLCLCWWAASNDDDDFLPWTSFRPQTKAGIFVTDCISLHILFVYVPERVCVFICVCVCLAWRFGQTMRAVCSFRAPFACFSTFPFSTCISHLPFSCQKCAKCKIKGGASSLSPYAVIYGKLPEGVANSERGQRATTCNMQLAAWSSHAKLWKCMRKRICWKMWKYFNGKPDKMAEECSAVSAVIIKNIWRNRVREISI